jgi:A/G-specific adenine glycosylase
MGAKLHGRDVRPSTELRTGVALLRRPVLRWYDRHRRALPWRADRDPYRVWVAEVMLQQTRIAVVEPAYRRFLEAFPTIERLAAAQEDDVLAQWSGLGYYRRARSLHRAARQLADATGEFPRDYAAARQLPGVGAYTAAAVLSIAFDQPHAAIDGNVVRVLSRLRRLGLPDSRGEPHAAIANELLARDRPGDWNQAIMELGETVCTPVAPICSACPVTAHCEAYRSGTIARHPPRKKRRATEKVAATMLVVRDRGDAVLLERGAFPYLPMMWLPIVVQGGELEGVERGEVRHAIMHWSFRIRVLEKRAGARGVGDLRKQAPSGAERRLFGERDLEKIGRSSLLQKALRVAGKTDRNQP